MKRRREVRRDLLVFLDALYLYLLGGYELEFAWRTALGELAPSFGRDFAALADLPPDSRLAPKLRQLSHRFPLADCQTWFALLADLHERGATQSDFVSAFAGLVRAEERSDWERHARELPTKLNLCLLVFFLPAAFVVLFGPFLLAMLGS